MALGSFSVISSTVVVVVGSSSPGGVGKPQRPRQSAPQLCSSCCSSAAAALSPLDSSAAVGDVGDDVSHWSELLLEATQVKRDLRLSMMRPQLNVVTCVEREAGADAIVFHLLSAPADAGPAAQSTGADFGKESAAVVDAPLGSSIAGGVPSCDGVASRSSTPRVCASPDEPVDDGPDALEDAELDDELELELDSSLPIAFCLSAEPRPSSSFSAPFRFLDTTRAASDEALDELEEFDEPDDSSTTRTFDVMCSAGRFERSAGFDAAAAEVAALVEFASATTSQRLFIR